MHPSDEDLELYYLHRLSPALIASIESHILECEICKEKVQRLSGSVGEIQRAVGRSTMFESSGFSKVPFSEARCSIYLKLR